MTSFLLPLLAALLTLWCATFLLWLFSHFQRREILVRALASSLFLVLILLLPAVIVHRFTTVGTPITVFSAIFLAATVFLGALLAPSLQKESVKIFLRRLGACAAVIFLLEIFLFNVKSYTAKPEVSEVDFSKAVIVTESAVTKNEDGSLLFKGNGTVTFPLNATNVSALTLVCEGEDERFGITVLIKDDNASRSFEAVAKKSTSAKFGRADFAFRPYGTLYEVQLQLTDVSSPVTLRSGTWQAKLPFVFESVRFLALVSLAAALLAVSAFKLYRIRYDRQRLLHRTAILVALLLCISAVLVMLQKNEPIKYPDAQMNMAAQNPYVQTFDAFYHGRLHLDITPSDKLLEMENPYDYSARKEAGVAYSWDRAFYDGRYYSYYGATPVVAFYAPYYFLTGELPTINVAAVFFGVLSIVFLFGTVLSFVKRFLPSPNLLLLLFALVGAAALSGVYYQTAFADMYLLPGVTSTCFLFLCLFAGIEACNRQKVWQRLLLLALCGLAFVLCIGARPTKALSALVLAPFFIGILFEKKSVGKKIADATAFLVPVAAGMALVMAYNYFRFDSPFEFGAQYQLTVNNVKSNALTLSSVPFALLHYLAQPFRMASDFPYVQVASHKFSTYGSYVYADFSVGALAFPSVLATALVLPFLHRYNRESTDGGARAERVIKRSTYLLTVLIVLAVAWLDFCMAGIILSYVLDLMPLLALLSTFVFLEAERKLSRSESVGHRAAFVFSLVSLLTVVTVIAMLFSFYHRGFNANIFKYLFRLEELFCFWN